MEFKKFYDELERIDEARGRKPLIGDDDREVLVGLIFDEVKRTLTSQEMIDKIAGLVPEYVGKRGDFATVKIWMSTLVQYIMDNNLIALSTKHSVSDMKKETQRLSKRLS